jgi:polyadenylate-binding protein
MRWRSLGAWTNCYVKHIPLSWTVEKLTETFAAYGTVTSATIMKTPAGESRGFGFVNFEETTQAQAAVAALNNLVVEVRACLVVRVCVRCYRVWS